MYYYIFYEISSNPDPNPTNTGLYNFENECQVCENNPEYQECCERCNEFWGYDEHGNEIELNKVINEGGYGYDEEYKCVTEHTIDLIAKGRMKGKSKF